MTVRGSGRSGVLLSKELLDQVTHLVHFERLRPDVDACDQLQVTRPLLELPDIGGAQDDGDLEQVPVRTGQDDELPAGNLLRPILEAQVDDQQVRLAVNNLADRGP
jgi:hypothetical protein